jgi:hypothetical protein
VDTIITLIAGATKIPKRILVGSERGELSSAQDKTSFDDAVSDRRRDLAEPQIVRPFIMMLTELGALPTPKQYKVAWPEIEELDEKDKAQVATQWADLNSKAGQTVVTASEIRDKVLRLDPLEEEVEEKVVFNGAQVTAALTITDSVSSGTLAPEAASLMLQLMFNMGEDDANELVGALEVQEVDDETAVEVVPPVSEDAPPAGDPPPQPAGAAGKARPRLAPGTTSATRSPMPHAESSVA